MVTRPWLYRKEGMRLRLTVQEEDLYNAIETLYDTLKIESEERADMLLAKHEPTRAKSR